MVGYIVKTHTTRLYNTPIQHENWDVKQKEKLAFTKVEKGGTYIRIWLGFSLYSLTKQTRQKEEEQKKTIKFQTGKEVMHQSLLLNE